MPGCGCSDLGNSQDSFPCGIYTLDTTHGALKGGPALSAGQRLCKVLPKCPSLSGLLPSLTPTASPALAAASLPGPALPGLLPAETTAGVSRTGRPRGFLSLGADGIWEPRRSTFHPMGGAVA
ncbi:Actin Filament-Associated Protein 1-Like 2 [Manis pentadactyla]|nr:Actin Filament-Associated Protein 1-Like 2 [Manis pentadactyla]